MQVDRHLYEFPISQSGLVCQAMSSRDVHRSVTLPGFRQLFARYIPPGLSDDRQASPPVAEGNPSRAVGLISTGIVEPPHPLSIVAQPVHPSQVTPAEEILTLPPIHVRDSPVDGSYRRRSRRISVTTQPAESATTKSGDRSPRPYLYVCSYCGRDFKRPSSLRTHTYSHDGTKPFECPVPGCLKAFSVKSNMKRHLSTHQKARRSSIPPPPAPMPVLSMAQQQQQQWHPTFTFTFPPPSFIQGSSRDHYPPQEQQYWHLRSSTDRDMLSRSGPGESSQRGTFGQFPDTPAFPHSFSSATHRGRGLEDSSLKRSPPSDE
ncbi:hypothetical protein BC835DRAFT_457805 [Cytidiella melzeri]|nr:hypothetical protein BC835DRAFT_457805 [Cytidiella melzeri]